VAAAAAASPVRLVRPLLAVSRGDVEAYCRDRNLAPRLDPTNENPRYPRSRIRALLPALARDFNPRLGEALRRLAQTASEEDDLVATMADRLWGRVATTAPLWVRLDAAALKNEHPALRRRVLLRALKHASGAGSRVAGEDAVSAANVTILEAMIRARRPEARDLAGGVRAESDGAEAAAAGVTVATAVPWAAPPALPYGFPLPVPGSVWVRPAAISLHARLVAFAGRSGNAGRRALTAVLPYGRMGAGPDKGVAGLCAPRLLVRLPVAGDRIAPPGMNGTTRLVRDVMADAGWPAANRACVPLVTSAETGEVLWIVGLCQAESARLPENGEGAGSGCEIRAEPDC
jgi:tRNA(Ile)-lysidine synthase